MIGASGEREALAEQARLTGLNEELTKELELVKHEMEMHREDLSAAHEHHDARSQVASETISEHVSEKEVLGERLAVRKGVFLRHFMLQMTILPRHARDKHRQSTQKQDAFPQAAEGDLAKVLEAWEASSLDGVLAESASVKQELKTAVRSRLFLGVPF